MTVVALTLAVALGAPACRNGDGGDASPAIAGASLTRTLELDGGTPLTVALRDLYDPAVPADAGTPDGGRRLVAVLLKVGTPGEETLSLTVRAAVVDAAGAAHRPVPAGVKDCPPLPATLRLAPGTSADGCVVFAVPGDVALVRLRVTAPGGGPPAEWDLDLLGARR